MDAAAWARVSPLLDQALDLAPGARADWLGALAAQQPDAAALLRQLLAAHEAPAAADALARAAPWPEAPGGPALGAGARVGPYRLLRLLGSGGMSDVWLAARDDGAPARQVALKLPLLPRLRPDLVQRLARERDILARLEHPGIARLYDAGLSAQGLPYLALELVDGRPLNTWCEEQRLPVAARLRLLLEVADAVQYAHSRLVIHRDLKPSNILVDSAGRVRLLDFGIAKLLQDDRAEATAITQHAGRALTLDYASPEQVRGEALTTASDQYSLGVLAFELLSGSKPYRLKRGSVAELEEAIDQAEPPPASQAAADPLARAALRGNLDAIIAKSLAKAPAARYPTVSEWAEDIRRHLAGRATVARPDTRWRALLRRAQRQRVPLAAAAAAALALVLGVGLGAAALVIAVLAAALALATLLARRARHHRLRAEADAERAAATRDFMLAVFHVGDVAAPGGRRPGGVTLKEALDSARTLERCEALYARAAPRAPERVHALGRLVQAYAMDDRLADAARCADSSLACAEAALDREPIELPNAYSVRGLMRLEAGDAAGARADLAAAYRRYHELLGEDHFLSQQNDAMLGHAEVAAAGSEAAIEAGLARAQRAVAGLRQSRPGHSTLARALERAALALLQAGRPAAAQPLLEEALQVWLALPPEQAAHGARTQVALARARRLNGDRQGARTLLQALQAGAPSGAAARKTVQRELRDELAALGELSALGGESP